jgi:hypothetical protein
MVFNKQEYNKQYSKIYYIKQKQLLKLKTLNNNNLDYMDLVVAKPLGQLALKRKRLERELKKTEERAKAFRKELEQQKENKK